jgi:hypothetical protein
MASRVLKRPMFRRGGMANQGIMSGLEDRSGYQDGKLVTETETVNEGPGVFTRIKDFLMPPTGKIVQRMQDVQQAPSLGEVLFSPTKGPLEFRTKAEADAYLAKNPDYKGKLKVLESGEIINTLVEEEVPGDGDGTTTTTSKGGTGGTGDLSESDLKTIYADLLPMFKETLGVDDEDYKKDAYLQLARFGTNLMAQPGGSLTQAIGAAAQKPLEGVADIIGAKRAAERRPKELALQAALRETEPGQIGKSVRDLMKLGYSKEDAIKEVVKSGGTGLAQVKARIIKEDEDALVQGAIVKNPFEARKLAKRLDKLNIGIEEIAKMPDDQEELIEGQIYVTKDGVIKKHKKGKFYKPGEKGFN